MNISAYVKDKWLRILRRLAGAQDLVDAGIADYRLQVFRKMQPILEFSGYMNTLTALNWKVIFTKPNPKQFQVEISDGLTSLRRARGETIIDALLAAKAMGPIDAEDAVLNGLSAEFIKNSNLPDDVKVSAIAALPSVSLEGVKDAEEK